MEELEKFRQIHENRHQYAKDWKAKTGGKVFGYFCTYAPEEIMYAAGILPVRIIGSHEPQDVTERHIYNMFCPFCRDCLAQGLQGRYDYLDGIFLPHSCIHIRQAFASWILHVPVPYSYYMFMPAKVQSPRAVPMLVSEYKAFKESLEKHLGKKISDNDINNAIEVYDTDRRLMRQVYETRKTEPPAIFGAEALEMVLASQLSDKAEHSKLVASLLKKLPQRTDGPKGDKIRLMIIGSEDDDTNFIRFVEGLQLGATFVADDHCTGSRYFWNASVPQADPLTTIAKRYLDRPPCPIKDLQERRRFTHILQMAKDYKVQGALLIQQKFCDPHEFDIPPLQRLLESNGIPCYFLEFDITVPVGQFQTRVEAFLETMTLELI